jgi:hypothetical protein
MAEAEIEINSQSEDLSEIPKITPQGGDLFSEIPKISELQRIKFVIDYLGLENYYVPKSEVTKDNTILIAFPEIVPDERISLQLFLINQKNPGEENSDDITMLHFYYDPKIKAKDENVVEIIDLIAKFNNVLPFGSFGYSDDNEVFFRYIYPYSEEMISAPLLSELLEMLNYYLHKLGLNLKAFAKGEKSYELALQGGTEIYTNLKE